MKSILVVEDDLQFQTALVRDLKSQGYEAKGSHGFDEAVQLIEKNPPDILLTDLRLGERDGIDLLERLVGIAPRTRAILMSAYATARDHQRATEFGAVRVLCKPFTPSELNEAIEQAIECGTGFRGSFHGLSLIDMLQMFHYGRRSITLMIGGSSPGTIHLQEGEIVHAQCGAKRGEEALKILLNTSSGSVQTSTVQEVPRTLHQRFENLLLDVLRVIDEDSVGAVRMPDLSEFPDDGETADTAPMTGFSGDVVVRQWETARARLGSAVDGIIVAVLESRRSAPLLVRGIDDFEPWRETVLGLLETAGTLCPEASRGIYEYAASNLGLGLAWDTENDLILFMAEPLTRDHTAVGLFRHHMSILADCFAPPEKDTT